MTSPASPGRPDGPGGSPVAARDRVHEQVRTLAAGGAAEIDALDGPVRVVSLLARPELPQGGEGAVLLLRDPAEFLDYFPRLSAAAARTTARWWPGAVTVEVDGRAEGLAAALPGAAASLRDAGARTRARCPNDPAVAAVLELSPTPLVQVGGESTETLVRLDEDGRWEVLVEGAVTHRDLAARQGETIVFVCTGNTCRSPLAEALLRFRLKEAVGPEVRVVSAGLSAAYGAAASPESVDLARQAGADLSAHRSQPLTEELLDAADRVLCMTAGHRAAILRHRPDARNRVTLLDPAGGDIPDPIGGEMADYEACRNAIDRGLDLLMAELGLVPPPGESPGEPPADRA
ncbi:low molecular weight protein arginine phosphatase [Alienimonas californiensis]|uniref:protein-tyrosine-phosphatase n=1 Tax=Alienimonas californiensis TaxID=2527989 RepID=A0A517PDH7_9PLAN|nr:low molecular weight protein arginine phosphatase [Alienimonas californiensis]QDT17381.1 Low molecular weight protein-tyrosine-phosphatase YwlE [Alienimonas californiensis]